jgi:hypothetical protein
MNVTQCDNCRKIGPLQPPGWLVVARVHPQEASFLAMLGGGGGSGMEVAGTFCGWPCAAQYATAKALIPDSGGGGT